MWKYIDVIPVDVHKINIESLHKQTLGLLPVIRRRIIDEIAKLNTEEVLSFPKEKLPLNNNILNEKWLEVVLNVLRERASRLSELKWWKPVVIFLNSWSYLNVFLKDILIWIFWNEDYSKFVKEIILPNWDEHDISDFNWDCLKNIDNDSIIIFPWFNTSIHELDWHFYSSHLAKIFANICNPFSTDNINNRLIAIWAWSQFVVNIMWKSSVMAWNLLTSIEWPIQYWHAICELEKVALENNIYRSIFSWLNFDWNERYFTWSFFRSWYSKFGFSGWDSVWWIIPLITEKHVWSTAAWWTSLAKAIWLNFNPEFDISKIDTSFVEFLKKSLWKYKWYNIDFETVYDNYLWSSVRSIWKNFYVFAILTYIVEILRFFKSKKNNIYFETSRRWNWDVKEYIRQMLLEIVWDQDLILNREKLVWRMDRKWYLEFVWLDRKVNRKADEVERFLWIKNLPDFIRYHFWELKNIWNNAYVLRDMWAWNWWTINSLDELLSELDNKFFYWVWDRMYFDIYEWIRNSKFSKIIPDDIIKLFCQKFVKVVMRADWVTLMEKVDNSIDSISLHTNDRISVVSLTHEVTTMFDDESWYLLDEEHIEYITKHYDIIKELIWDIKRNLYKYFIWDVEKVILSKFSDFSISPEYSWVDLQIAVRSTSHIDDFEYRWVLYQRVHYSAKKWAICIDNWVHRSYIWTPRLSILHDLYMFFNSKISIKLVYDRDANYFTSAIIQVYPFIDNDELEKFIIDEYILVDIEDAYKCTYFKLEFFFRTFLITNFKDKEIFWTYNKDIIIIMTTLTKLSLEWHTDKIKEAMVEAVNKIVIKENYKKKKFNEGEVNQRTMTCLEESTKFWILIKKIKSINNISASDVDTILYKLENLDKSVNIRQRLIKLFIFFRTQEYIESVIDSIFIEEDVKNSSSELINDATYLIFSTYKSSRKSDIKKILIDTINKIFIKQWHNEYSNSVSKFYELDINNDNFDYFFDKILKLLRISDDHLRYVIDNIFWEWVKKLTKADIIKIYIYFRIEEFIDFMIVLILEEKETIFKYSELILPYSIKIYELFLNKDFEKIKGTVVKLINDIVKIENMYYEFITVEDLVAFTTFDWKWIDDILSEKLYPTMNEIDESWFNQNWTVRY